MSLAISLKNTKNERMRMKFRNFYFLPNQKIRSQKKVRTNGMYFPDNIFEILWSTFHWETNRNHDVTRTSRLRFALISQWNANHRILKMLSVNYLPVVLTFFEIEFFDSVKNKMTGRTVCFIHFYRELTSHLLLWAYSLTQMRSCC